ncbi:hypothetical protein ACFLWX_03245, partial [Chloroflexota bacterium]
MNSDCLGVEGSISWNRHYVWMVMDGGPQHTCSPSDLASRAGRWVEWAPTKTFLPILPSRILVLGIDQLVERLVGT